MKRNGLLAAAKVDEAYEPLAIALNRAQVDTPDRLAMFTLHAYGPVTAGLIQQAVEYLAVDARCDSTGIFHQAA